MIDRTIESDLIRERLGGTPLPLRSQVTWNQPRPPKYA